MYELIIQSEFSAAHRLREYQGACERLHGHNWRIEVRVGGERLNELGMLVDFRDLKRILSEVADRFDHQYLNELAEFTEQNPTTENIARILFEDCSRKMPDGVRVADVTVWESSRCGARYSGDRKEAHP